MKRLLSIPTSLAVLTAFAVFFSACGQSSGTTAATSAGAAQAPVSAAAEPPPVQPTAAEPIADASPTAYVEGQHYRRVPHPAPVDNPKVVQVEEYFWYGCPHCLHMEALLATWIPKLPADAHFVRVPENLGRPEGIIHQRAFYAAQNLGVESKVHLPLMTALVVQHQPLVTPQVIANFVASQAQVSAADFNSQYASFVVDGEVRSASERSFAYGITGVPSVVVGGKYLVDSDLPGIAAGNAEEGSRFTRMLKVASFLVDKVRDEQAPTGH